MTTIKKTADIKIGKRTLSRTKQDINLMVNSLKQNGLINPIIIDSNSNLIAGYIRYMASINLGWTEIECIVLENKSKEDLLLIEIDENLVNKNLSKWEKGILLSLRKEAYIKLNPSSIKAHKSAQNGKDKEKRESTTDLFSKVASEQIGCSSKTVDNYINQYNQINDNCPTLATTLTDMEKKSRDKLKGVDIKVISKLSLSDMDNLANTMKLKNQQKEKFSIRDLLNDAGVVRTKNKNDLELIFKYDLLEIVSKSPRYSNLKDKIKIDTNEVKKLKRKKKVSFKNQIEYLLDLVYDSNSSSN